MIMPTFSNKSQSQLDTCDNRIQVLFNEVIKVHDCTIIEGYRPPDRQLELYNSGQSKVKQGKHNFSPSLAVDVAPYIGRIPWPKDPSYIKDMNQFYYFSGIVLGIASQLGISIRWGGDWDRDHDLSDQTFDDLVHFEIGD